MKSDLQPQKAFAATAVVLSGLAWIGAHNYLIFHALTELFAITVAAAIFVIAWNARDSIDNGYLLFLGIGCIFIAIPDLLHTLAYQGMGVFPGYDANLPTQLWIVARGLQALTFVAAAFYLDRRVRPFLTIAAYSGALALLLLSIFVFRIFPECYVEGHGLTEFKINAEYAICAVLALAFVRLWLKRRKFNRQILLLLYGAILATILSELAFTRYITVFGNFNMAGHLLKIVAFLFLYRAIVHTGFRQPYELLFRSLTESERKFRSAVESNIIGVVFTDLITGTVTEANDEFLRIIGRTREELEQGKINWKEITPPESLVREEVALASRLSSKESVPLLEKEYIRRDGSRVPVIIGNAFIGDSRRRLVSYVLDNTARKEAEQQLTELNESLEKRVRERTAEAERRAFQLRELATDLTLSEQRERQRLAMVLHDGLQQILVAAKFRVAMLEREKDLGKAATEISGLIDEAIQTSRSLTAELCPPILYRGGLVAALEWLVRLMEEKHGLSVEFISHPAESLPEEIAVMIFRSVRELLFNVVKHAAVKTARMEVKQQDGCIRLEISDEGAGFDPGRISAGNKTGGMGLFSIRERLGFLGGRMEIESAPGQGSRFTLITPLLRSAMEHSASAIMGYDTGS